MARNLALPWVVLPLNRLPPLCAVFWAHPSPRSQVFVGWKARHVLANLCQKSCGGNGLNPWKTHQQRESILKRGQALLDILLALFKDAFD
jgi:hypothetical protein